ncbi:hypothetical protein [Hyphomicrobium sp. LHD-15]|uniref:hypothetical protein n=1 Tax=Hyphomicrobium sp. LHD-15 TaxID=3072142 RepID=UPI00280D6D26|nr:hypothetical protein [Hyphomicrobium sp. LHD-15]MDQ8698232.1 hypothetical protein [Hyphomicrobium sp. LHD-15]
MAATIEPGFMVFVAEGSEGIAAVREVRNGSIVLYIENRGEFVVPRKAVTSVHDQKVMLDPALLDRKLLEAIGHAHDSEDPNLVG